MELQRIEIGQLSPDQKYQIQRIIQNYHQQGQNPLFNWPDELVLGEFKQSVWCLSLEADLVLAFISLRESEDVLEIMCLAVHPNFQNRGLMKNLLKFLIDNAHSQNKRVLLEVHENNHKALQLYLGQGFQKIHTRKGYYRDGGQAFVLESKRRV